MFSKSRDQLRTTWPPSWPLSERLTTHLTIHASPVPPRAEPTDATAALSFVAVHDFGYRWQGDLCGGPRCTARNTAILAGCQGAQRPSSPGRLLQRARKCGCNIGLPCQRERSKVGFQPRGLLGLLAGRRSRFEGDNPATWLLLFRAYLWPSVLSHYYMRVAKCWDEAERTRRLALEVWGNWRSETFFNRRLRLRAFYPHRFLDTPCNERRRLLRHRLHSPANRCLQATSRLAPLLSLRKPKIPRFW